MITPTTREEWEQLDAGELDGYSDQQLKTALQDCFGLKSHVYFMPVALKKEYILTPDKRPEIQEGAEQRQKEHQAAGAEHKGKKPISEMITEASDGRTYTFVGVDRPQGGFTDPFSERTGKVAYIIADTADGEEFPTQKQTCKKLDELGRLQGFDERIAAVKQKPANAAGHLTIEDIIASADPVTVEVEEALDVEPDDGFTEGTPAIDVEPIDADKEAALDAILNNLPQ